MASYPDPSNPIIIEASQTLTASSDFFLRRVCFVSTGESSVSKGSFQSVSQSTYASYVSNTNSWLYKQLQSFFMYTTSSYECYILEVGSPDSEVSAMDDITAYLVDSGDSNTYNVKFKTNSGDLSVNVLSMKVGQTFNLVAQTESDETLTLPTSNTYLTTSANGSTYTYTAESVGAVNLVVSGSKTDKSVESATLTINISEATYSYDTCIDNIVTAINESLVRCYVYCISSTLVNQEYISNLYALCSSLDSALYVFGELDSIDSANEALIRGSGNKGVLFTYETGSTYKTLGCVAGVFASSLFNVTSSNPASPLNFKQASSFSPATLSTTNKNLCINNCITFIGEVAGITCILGTRMQDGNTFDYWYQWDLVSYYLQNDLISLLINAANNPRQGIVYNQNGIDSITAKVEAILTTMKDYGCITAFAASYDSTTNSLTNTDKIYATSFEDYIASNAENYSNGIYGGITFYVQIARYIQQIVLNITIS